jgi:hypothetical protein
MVNKIALFVAAVAASVALVTALATAGFAPGATPASAAAATAADSTTPAPEIATQPQVQVDTVYVAPPAKQQTITVHKVVHSAGTESETEAGDD